MIPRMDANDAAKKPTFLRRRRRGKKQENDRNPSNERMNHEVFRPFVGATHRLL
jgi:hypothetical protein